MDNLIEYFYYFIFIAFLFFTVTILFMGNKKQESAYVYMNNAKTYIEAENFSDESFQNVEDDAAEKGYDMSFVEDGKLVNCTMKYKFTLGILNISPISTITCSILKD